MALTLVGFLLKTLVNGVKMFSCASFSLWALTAECSATYSQRPLVSHDENNTEQQNEQHSFPTSKQCENCGCIETLMAGD